MAGLFISVSARTLESSIFAPIQYSQLLAGLILGYLFFRDLPDLFEIVGSIIIILQSNQHLSNKILDLFKENYQNYYHVRYQNLYTRYIEKLFENSLGVFNPGKIGRLIIKISLAYYLESITSKYNFTGNSYLFFGMGLNRT